MIFVLASKFAHARSTTLLAQPTHATAELHWLGGSIQVRYLGRSQRNFGGSWRSLSAALKFLFFPHRWSGGFFSRRTNTDYGEFISRSLVTWVTPDAMGFHFVGSILPYIFCIKFALFCWTNVSRGTPAQHYRHPESVFSYCCCTVEQPCYGIKLIPWVLIVVPCRILLSRATCNWYDSFWNLTFWTWLCTTSGRFSKIWRHFHRVDSTR